MNNRITLTPELIIQISYAMENQKEKYVFNLEKGTLILLANLNEEENYIVLPEWDSMRGFYMMEAFVDTLPNLILKEELREILKRQQGVFRNFKNSLKAYPMAERKWYYFKLKKMKEHIIKWAELHNDYLYFTCFPEDTDKLDRWEASLLSDFSYEKTDKSYWNESLKPHLLEVEKEGVQDSHYYYNCLTPSGEIVGWLCFSKKDCSVILDYLFILPSFRGFGLGHKAITFLKTEAKKLNAHELLVTTPSSQRHIQKLLEELEFTSKTVTYSKAL